MRRGVGLELNLVSSPVFTQRRRSFGLPKTILNAPVPQEVIQNKKVDVQLATRVLKLRPHNITTSAMPDLLEIARVLRSRLSVEEINGASHSSMSQKKTVENYRHVSPQCRLDSVYSEVLDAHQWLLDLVVGLRLVPIMQTSIIAIRRYSFSSLRLMPSKEWKKGPNQSSPLLNQLAEISALLSVKELQEWYEELKVSSTLVKQVIGYLTDLSTISSASPVDAVHLSEKAIAKCLGLITIPGKSSTIDHLFALETCPQHRNWVTVFCHWCIDLLYPIQTVVQCLKTQGKSKILRRVMFVENGNEFSRFVKSQSPSMTPRTYESKLKSQLASVHTISDRLNKILSESSDRKVRPPILEVEDGNGKQRRGEMDADVPISPKRTKPPPLDVICEDANGKAKAGPDSGGNSPEQDDSDSLEFHLDPDSESESLDFRSDGLDCQVRGRESSATSSVSTDSVPTKSLFAGFEFVYD